MLSKKTKYAINALVFLGKNNDLAPFQIAKIAEEALIPKKFLEQILLEMRNHGFVFSKRGHSGGYSLNKNPNDIRLIDVLRLTEGPIAMVPCASQKFYHKCDECQNEYTCGIRDVFLNVHKQVLNILSKSTIADIISREHLLMKTKTEKE